MASTPSTPHNWRPSGSWGGAEALVTLPGGQGTVRPAHRRFARSLAAFREAMPDAGLKYLSGESASPDPLKHLERHLFQSEALPQPANGHVSLIEARSPADEAREALRWIKARIVRGRLHPDGCALVTPDPERYCRCLREAGFQETPMPCMGTWVRPRSHSRSESASTLSIILPKMRA